MRCIDLTELYPLRMAPVCVRGKVGCPVVHQVGALRPVVIERERELPVAGRASDDFEGCRE